MRSFLKQILMGSWAVLYGENDDIKDVVNTAGPDLSP